MKRRHVLVALGLTLAGALTAAAALPSLPDLIPIHWNFQGKVDGYGSKWTVLLMPGLMLLMMALFLAIPWLSPQPFVVDTFRDTFSYIAMVTIGLFAYLHLVILWAQLHHPVDLSRPLIGGLFLFFAVLGNVMGKVRRNFWMGVRTPWTLASERVWNDTHRLSAKLFVASGLAGFVAVMLGLNPAITLVLLVPVLIVPVIYSLVEYKQLERQGER